MPALSQNLIFKIPNGPTTYDSVQIQYPNEGQGSLTYLSERIKGDGYFGGSDGFHTAFWSIAGFTGTIDIQGTLASAPIEADWVTVRLTEPGHITRFTMDASGAVISGGQVTTSYTGDTFTKSYNFVGNFVWIRAKISNFTQGVVNRISINR